MHLAKTTITAIIILCLFAVVASGQNPKIDSLEAALKVNTQADTAKVDLLSNLAYEIRLHDPQKAKLYARQSMELSLQLNYPKGKAASLWVTGLSIMRSDKETALGYYREALKIALEIGDKAGQCRYLTSIGTVIKEKGDLKASNEAYGQALRIARELKDTKRIIRILFNLTSNKTRSGDHIGAIKQLQEIVKTAKEIDDKEMVARAYASLGVIYNIRGNYPAALEYLLRSLEINEKRNDYVGIYSTLINIGNIQSEQNDFDAALGTMHKALHLATEHRDSTRISASFNCLGIIYRRINRPEALDYFQKSLSMSKFNKLAENIDNLINIGSIYTDRGDFDKALTNLNEALALAPKANKKTAFGEVYGKIGVLYLKQKKYGPAKEHLQKALAFAKQSHFIDLQKDCHKMLSDIYAATGDFKNAYTNHVQYRVLNDSIINEKNTRKVALLESSYKFAKEREIYELEKSGSELKIKSQRQAILLLAVISLLVLSLTFAVYRSGKLRKNVLKLKIENMNRELEANQKAMAVAKLKLVQNSERDAHNVKMLEDIGKNAAGEGQKNISSLVNNYKLQTNHSNWEEFETLFTKVNSSFWDKLNGLCPTLTSNERKLCVFLKLNMSNKDISLITFQTEEALKKSRLRLRKKFNLDRSANLAAFIQNL